MADNRRLTEEQKRRIAEAHKRAAASRSTGASGKTASASVASATAGGKTASSKSAVSAATSPKAAKTVTGSEKKKMTSKMKQTVRKSIAGVCLVSSLIIAAIPGDKSGVAKALDPSWAPSNSMDYSGASSEARNGDVQLSGKDFLSYDPVIHSDKDWSFCIYESATGYMLDSQFECYDASSHGVISSYNPSSINSSLRVPQVISLNYDGPDKDVYERFVRNMKNRYFVLPAKDDGYVDSFKVDSNGQEIDHQDFKFDLLKNYLKSTEDGTTQIKDDESISRFFSDSNDHSGCAVRKVLNGTTGKSGSEQYPDTDSELYIYQHVEGNWSDPLDENDFCIAANSWKKIDAISDDAFRGLSCPEVVIDSRIGFLGNQVFQNSDIESIDLSGIKEIGNRVFQGCDDLKTVYLSKNVSAIGKEAFQGCSALRAIGEKAEISDVGEAGAKFPASLTKICYGAFADCTSLSGVDFSLNDGLNVTIGEYAFYNTLKLADVNFPEDGSVALGTAAFALPSGNATMTEFTFPILTTDYISPSDAAGEKNYRFDYRSDDEYGTYESKIGDYVLANRSGLRNVTFRDFGSGYTPANDKGQWQWVPYSTFMGCSGLDKVDFGNNKFIAYDYKLFRDVANTSFCVWGPMDANEVTVEPGAHYARPRYCTWTAVPNDPNSYIPYCYEVTDVNGSITRHYEVGQETGDPTVGTDCSYICDIISDRPNPGQATLYNCIYFPGDEGKELGSSKEDPFMLPDQIGTYKLTNLGANCFENDLLNHIKNFKVNDSLIEIGDAAFTNAAILENVFMGKGMQSIGEGAFKNCDKLEHVYWGMDSAVNSIKEDAFLTSGRKLYFHGNVSDSFYPYTYAMENNYINKNNTRICYVSDYYDTTGNFSGGLCMLRDNGSGQVTLVDYPHINDSYDDDLARLNQKLRDGSGLTDAEQKLRDASMYLVLPGQITSIDTKAFINDRKNEMNLVYFEESLNVGEPSRQTIYNKDDKNYPSGQEHHIGGYHAGIFSGEMEENKDSFLPSVSGRVNGLDVTSPVNIKGNDWIQSVKMPGVTSLPDYAFDSCENLQSVIMSGNCGEIGKNVFQGCSSLQPGGVTIENANNKYSYDNSMGILFENLGNGTKKVITCLSTVKDPVELGEDVSELNIEAFCGCESVPSFDLNKTTIEIIPERAFDHCRLASSIKLPATAHTVEYEAFDNSARNVTITIPNTGVMELPDKAFDENADRVTLCGYKGSTPEKKGNRSDTDNIYFVEIGKMFTMTFLNDDSTVYDTYPVYLHENETSGRGEFPTPDPTPLLYTNYGCKFNRWVWIDHEDVTGNALITNITEDRTFMAYYEPTEPKVHKVTFLYDDGSLIREDSVYDGDYIKAPENVVSKINPTYEFIGWSFQPDTFDESMTVKQDIIATATFSIEYYTVNFYYDDMTLYKSIKVPKGGYLPSLEIPESKLNPGTQYIGWKFTPASFKITDRVTQDGIIGVAAYSSSKIPEGFHSVTFYNDDNSIFMEYTV
ncbi:MAG: leucine-rich repeat domain-containing protein, partial [Lachnospiraceae bacterium]|nr:leucine-rich repeat domain-containing protein [Lachnospiraceae bacterium]